MRVRDWSDWTTRERWVVGVIVLVAAAVVLSQLNGDGTIGSALVYAGFMLGMVGLVLASVRVFRSAGRQQVGDSGLSTAQKVMLAAGVIVLVWAAVDAAGMDGGFVPAAFLASAAIGLAYVTVVGLGAMALIRSRNR